MQYQSKPLLPRLAGPIFSFCFLCVIVVAPTVRAQGSDEFDTYKVRLEGFWVYSNPSGSLQSSIQNGTIDLQKDLGFNNYSTFAGKLASASLLAPIPVAGPEFRLYLTNSPRLFVEGNLYGMYFFGYGNYVSAAGD